MVINKKRTLQDRFLDISKEWHPTLNGNKTPSDFTYGSNQKVWWQCKKNKDHAWIASITSRTRKGRTGNGCPHCKSLANLSPEIAKEWHPTLNAPLTPQEVFNKSGKKVWWQCPLHKDHVYQSRVAERAYGAGCPLCRGNKKISRERSLAFLSPEVFKEWHPTLNEPLKAEDVFNGSTKKVWWQCQENKEHIWKSAIRDRTRSDKRKTKGCRICNR